MSFNELSLISAERGRGRRSETAKDHDRVGRLHRRHANLDPKKKRGEYNPFEQLLADVRDHREVEAVRLDNEGELMGVRFVFVQTFAVYGVKYIISASPEFNGVTERGLDNIRKVGISARPHSSVLYPHTDFLMDSKLWAEAMFWACDPVSRTATTPNVDGASAQEMGHRTAEPL